MHMVFHYAAFQRGQVLLLQAAVLTFSFSCMLEEQPFLQYEELQIIDSHFMISKQS